LSAQGAQEQPTTKEGSPMSEKIDKELEA